MDKRHAIVGLMMSAWAVTAAAQVNRENITGPLRDAMQQREQRMAEEQRRANGEDPQQTQMQVVRGPQLIGFASLPADVFRAGPTSGQFIGPSNGRTPPFEGRQPIQGISAVIRTADGRLLGLSDNGFGSKANSADYVLTVYELRPDFRREGGGSGMLRIHPGFELRDPDHQIPFAIVADAETYPADGESIAVDPAIREQRLLTGADFDLESFRELPDGTLVFGDEFGPFLLHTDATGKVLGAPVDLPAGWSPQHPTKEASGATIGPSSGFEGMAQQGARLLPMLEKPRPQDGQRVAVFAYDSAGEAYVSPDPVWYYPLDAGATSIGDFTPLRGEQYLVIERDNAQGPDARIKRLYLADASNVAAGGTVRKRLLLDLLQIPDPLGLSPDSENGVLRFPFVTIESVVVLDDRTLGIVNDNNYPFSVGRHAGATNEPDPTEFLLIRFDRPIGR